LYRTFAPMSKISIDIGTGRVRRSGNLVVGIDLGTTNSLVAIYDTDLNKPTALSGRSGKRVITPSVVHFDDSTGFLIGEKARELMASHPEQTVYSVKRLLGKSYSDISTHHQYYQYKIIDDGTDNLVKVQLGDRFYSPIELSAEILKELKLKAERSVGHNISKAVITVPAYFNDTQRQATRDAGKLAGLEVLRIINEPTAASLAYGLNTDPKSHRNIAVYDFGGGTFDISLLRIEDGVFEVLSTHGDTFLGGDDIDQAIIHFWRTKFPELIVTLSSPSTLAEIRLLAEQAKRHLGEKDEFTATFHGTEIKLSKESFENILRPFVNRTIESCKLAIKDSELEIGDIQEVVLVGGSTRIPLVKLMVTDYFSQAHINNQIDPDEVVALGAAVEADILSGNRKDMLLLDITPLSLGIETIGGLMDVIIPRNSKVPTAVGRNYTTSVDGQVNLQVSVFQGERDKVAENRKLAEFVMKGIPAMPAGIPKIEITFMLDADGILKVRAKELRSNVEQEVVVKPKNGLTDEQVEKMLLESVTNAQKDMDFRSLKEATNEAEFLIVSTNKFISDYAGEITPEELIEIKNLIAMLQKEIVEENKDGIYNVQERLNDFTKPFAEKVMDRTIQTALKGKSIRE
jgi:molecular chaperone HscA